MKDNIPDHAVTITFEYDKISGRIHVWKTMIESWQWSALGNCGEEATYEEAIKSARNWVRGLVTKTDKEI